IARRQKCAAYFTRAAMLQKGFERYVKEPRTGSQDDEAAERLEVSTMQQIVACRNQDAAGGEQRQRHDDDSNGPQGNDSQFDPASGPQPGEQASQSAPNDEGEH